MEDKKEFSKRYEKTLQNGNRVSVELSIKGECTNESELLETLSFMAASAHRFYLEAAQEIKNRFS